MNDLISVVIPIYNTELFLPRCIESIQNQTYDNLEIILVDDGSVDSSLQIAKRYAEQDNRIKVISQTNHGVSVARNSGINVASGKWIAFVDSDDTVKKEYFYHVLKNAIENECDVSLCISNEIDEDDNYMCDNSKIESLYVLDSEQAIYHLVRADIFGCGINKLYRADILKKINMPKNIAINEDYLMNYYCMRMSNKVVCSNATLYNYRNRRGSASRSGFNVKNYDVVKVNKIICEEIEKSSDNKQLMSISEARYLNAIVGCCRGASQIKDNNSVLSFRNILLKEFRRYIANENLTIKTKLEIILICYAVHIYMLCANINKR